MKTAWLPVVIACLFLVSCATMKNAETRPTEGSCMASYDSGRIGEKEILAGAIILPVGGGLTGIGIPLALLGNVFNVPGSDEGFDRLFIAGVTLSAIGGLAMIAGIVLLIDGKSSIDKWNDYCVGTTATERYCLFEPLPISSGETP